MIVQMGILDSAVTTSIPVKDEKQLERKVQPLHTPLKTLPITVVK